MADILDEEWEDKEVVDYIVNFLDKSDRKRVSRQNIQDVLDYIVDYYDSKGYIEDDDNDEDTEVVSEAEIDEEEMFNFIKDKIAADDNLKHIDDDLLSQIIDGEYNYGVSIGIYDNDDDEEYDTEED
ncbi:MAG: hypothetical protein IJU35_07035 [Paludibacteraceae bacterium]|nr:hypothetical protein [Paludibacteraceae bacterium]